MGLFDFLKENWFTLLQTSGIIAGLFLNAAALKADAKSRRVSNLLTLTSQHREIWTRFDNEPSLARVLDAEANLVEMSVTREEDDFTRTVILHLNSAFHAMRDGC